MLEIQESRDTDAVNSPTAAQTRSLPSTPAKQTDQPPIVTYPEFLTQPSKPPPLMTMTTFLNTLCAFGGLSTLIYGTSKLVLAPMVDSLTDARLELHPDTS